MNTSENLFSTDHILSRLEDTKAIFSSAAALSDLRRYLLEHYSTITWLPITASDILEGPATAVLEGLQGVSLLDPVVIPVDPPLHADYNHCEGLRRKIAEAGEHGSVYPLAIGSGTLNDLVKVAAKEADLPYAVAATAASVDGYTSYGAAILKDGFKQTISCRAPAIVCLDPLILATAPAQMNAAGFGDLASKYVAGSDWLIAEAAGEAEIDPESWHIVQKGLTSRLSSPGLIAGGDGTALASLAEGLSRTGFAMQIYRDSRPVSGCEHLCSHIWEMQNLEQNGKPVLHGIKVAIGTLLGVAFTEELLKTDPADWAPPDIRDLKLHLEARVFLAGELFADIPGAIDSIKRVLERKEPSAEALDTRIKLLRGEWSSLRRKVSDQLPSYDSLKQLLADAGCPVHYSKIGLDRESVMRTFPMAQMLRHRYTALDLAWDAGLIDRLAAKAVDRMDETVSQ